MPASEGTLNGESVVVLKDTGSNTVVVKRQLVPSEAFTGTEGPIYLVDGSCQTLQEAKVQVSCPYYSGTVRAKTQNGFTELEENNVSTDRVPTSKEKVVPSIAPARREVWRDDLSQRQKLHPTLAVVVPQDLRPYILKVAHEGTMAGHQGIKMADRVLEAFFWPGVEEQIKRFVNPCQKCQRVTSKGKIAKASLGNMSIIETPFECVAIDLIGPFSQSSDTGNRLTLTMVDCDTRYPDTVALPSMDSKTMAEGLIQMFSRVGVPQEILSEQAPLFPSALMNKVSCLLSIQQLTTTPYHPMCNGDGGEV
ncbi:uncharacterized protein K02A2.6-like [Ixodes scapularis]|uniref:uncharacterized protein K02A2.6-like n=1 Tax=Ixodes scapularis TaxID=6945 RepID=UPI001A9FB8C2|nr:uncharacterized protein K02A2.6-like [Ixodes scapularis]